MTNIEVGTYVKPTEAAEEYLFADSNMKLGIVMHQLENGDYVIAPAINDFMTAEIALSVLLGKVQRPHNDMLIAAGADGIRPATDEELAELADEIEDYEANSQALKLKEGVKVRILDVPGGLPVDSETEYEVFNDGDDVFYYIVDADGDKINSVFTLFKYEVIEEGN